MNERISLFDLIILPFDLYLHRHHVFLQVRKNQKVAVFELRLLKKRWILPPSFC
jgi:hypothetical protein